MAKDIDSRDLARVLFIFTIMGVVVYVGVVFLFIL